MKNERVIESGVERRVGYQMKRAQHALRTEMDRALREMKLTTPQYAVLSALEATPGLSGAELAKRSFVTPQTMNQIVVKLEDARLVARRPHPKHGRVLQTYLTDKGEKLVSQAHRIVESIEERMLTRLNRDEQRCLLDALRSCADSLESREESTNTRGSR